MEDKCGRILNMAKLREHSMSLTFLRSSAFFATRSCDLAIDSGHWWAEDVSWNKILFQFLDFQNHGPSCVSFRQSNDRSHWESASKTIGGLEGSYCARDTPPLNKPFTTDIHNLLVIKFKADSFFDDSSLSFKLILNVLHSDGSCNQYECDNGNCIPKELQCSQYNPCGDDSHCPPEGTPVQTIIFIVIGVTAGVVFIALVVKYIRCKGKNSDDDTSATNGNLTSMGQMTSPENRSASQGLQIATAPEIVVEHEEEDGDFELSNMLADAQMPPPSYEEVMAAEQR